MRFWAISAIGAMLVTAPAWGADLPAGPPPPQAPAIYAPVPSPAYNWSGFYVGLNAGYGFATATETAPGLSSSIDLSGFVGGAQVGANYQFGAAVFGVEADFDGTTQSYTTSALGATGTAKIPYFTTIRGRIGAAFDRILVYATAGGGWGEESASITVPGVGSASSQSSRFIWAAGAGLEYGITQNLSARIEYLFLDTGSFTVASFPGFNVTGTVYDDIVRAGVNYRF